LIFIREGKITLNTSMDEIAERFTEVMVGYEHYAAAKALGPIDERSVFGKTVFLFDGINRSTLASLGDMKTPGIADLFVATMKGTYA